MQVTERFAASAAYLLGAFYLLAGAATVWLIASSSAAGSSLPLPGLHLTYLALGISGAGAGGLLLYAGTQIAYSVPGWQKEGASMLFATAVAALAAAWSISLLVGIGAAALAITAASALWRSGTAGESVDVGRSLALSVSPLLLAAATALTGVMAPSLDRSWDTLAPAEDPEVAAVLAPMLQGDYDHAHLTPGIPVTSGTSIDFLVDNEPSRTSSRSLGSSDLETCEGWGVQSNDRLDNGSLLALGGANPSVAAYDFWVSSDGIRARAASGATSFRTTRGGNMLPYLGSVREIALLGAHERGAGICSLLHALPRTTSLADRTELSVTLRIREADAERAARVGTVALQYRELTGSGMPSAVAALRVLTRAEVPSLTSVSLRPREITIHIQNGVIRSFNVTAPGESPQVLETVVLRDAARPRPPLPDPNRLEPNPGLLLRALGPGKELR